MSAEELRDGDSRLEALEYRVKMIEETLYWLKEGFDLCPTRIRKYWADLKSSGDKSQ